MFYRSVYISTFRGPTVFAIFSFTFLLIQSSLLSILWETINEWIEACILVECNYGLYVINGEMEFIHQIP